MEVWSLAFNTINDIIPPQFNNEPREHNAITWIKEREGPWVSSLSGKEGYKSRETSQ